MHLPESIALQENSTDLKIITQSTIYCDASFKEGVGASYGFVFFDEIGFLMQRQGIIKLEELEIYNSPTCTSAEYVAFTKAVECAIELNKKSVLVYTDYLVSVDVCNRKAKKFRGSAKYFLIKISEYEKKIKIKAKFVRAHRNNKFNEMAHTLAKEVIKRMEMEMEKEW